MKKIIHIDMDCFFAAIEIRDNPQLRGKAVAVGGNPASRGVIAAASYEARAYGVQSALSSREALKRCPSLILLAPDAQKYRAVSRQIFAVLSNYSDTIEPLSIDEAFIDVTHQTPQTKTATHTARLIRQHIFQQTGLTASAGIAANPFLAKVASDWKKPNGQFTIAPHMVVEFMRTLPLRKIPGVGSVTEAKLKTMGFETCGDIQALDKVALLTLFGKWGNRLFDLCRGHDDRQLCVQRSRKSVSVERTFECDLKTLDDCVAMLPALLRDLEKRWATTNVSALKNIFVKVKFSDFKITTVEDSTRTSPSLHNYQALLVTARGRSDKAVRLIGLGIRLQEKKPGPFQLELFKSALQN